MQEHVEGMQLAIYQNFKAQLNILVKLNGTGLLLYLTIATATYGSCELPEHWEIAD